MAAQLLADSPRPEMTAQVDDATMHKALETLGADPMTVLTEEEREHLLTQGFLYVPCMPGFTEPSYRHPRSFPGCSRES